jgi:hypothetical protein
MEVRGTSNNFLDEIRIGRSFPAASVAVVPEPSSALLLACGGPLLVLTAHRSRRRRRNP